MQVAPPLDNRPTQMCKPSTPSGGPTPDLNQNSFRQLLECTDFPTTVWEARDVLPRKPYPPKTVFFWHPVRPNHRNQPIHQVQNLVKSLTGPLLLQATPIATAKDPPNCHALLVARKVMRVETAMDRMTTTTLPILVVDLTILTSITVLCTAAETYLQQ